PNLEQEFARDPRQQTRIDVRGQRGAILYDEEVRLRAFRQLTPVVPHHAFETSTPKRFLHRERVVQEVVRFDQGAYRARMVPDDRHERNANALLEHLARGGHVRLRNDNDRWSRAGGGIVGKLTDASRHQNADVRLMLCIVAQTTGPHRLAEGTVDLRIG